MGNKWWTACRLCWNIKFSTHCIGNNRMLVFLYLAVSLYGLWGKYDNKYRVKNAPKNHPKNNTGMLISPVYKTNNNLQPKLIKISTLVKLFITKVFCVLIILSDPIKKCFGELNQFLIWTSGSLSLLVWTWCVKCSFWWDV